MFNWTPPTNFGIGLLLLVLWESFWKGIGLWKSAKRGDLVWFVAIFIINFFGIVPIIYLWRTKQLNGVGTDIQHFFKTRFGTKK